jgi:hypothetical protein
MPEKRPANNILPYMFPYIIPQGHAMWLQVVEKVGGRSRARTADLLLVRKTNLVFQFHRFHPVLCVFSILGSLLSLKQVTPDGSSDGVLIRF